MKFGNYILTGFFLWGLINVAINNSSKQTDSLLIVLNSSSPSKRQAVHVNLSKTDGGSLLSTPTFYPIANFTDLYLSRLDTPYPQTYIMKYHLCACNKNHLQKMYVNLHPGDVIPPFYQAAKMSCKQTIFKGLSVGIIQTDFSKQDIKVERIFVLVFINK